MTLRGALPFLAILAGFPSGCSHAPVEDLSPDAVTARDLTLVSSACQAAPGQGLDICRVNESAAVSGDWLLVIPQGATTLGGELTAVFRDSTRTYAVAPGVKTFSLPWRDFFVGTDKWAPEMSGVIMALLVIRYKDGQGVVQVAAFRGMAYIEVMKPGYARLPVGSSLSAWKADCHIEYTTSGRSAVSCR